MSPGQTEIERILFEGRNGRQEIRLEWANVAIWLVGQNYAEDFLQKVVLEFFEICRRKPQMATAAFFHSLLRKRAINHFWVERQLRSREIQQDAMGASDEKNEFVEKHADPSLTQTPPSPADCADGAEQSFAIQAALDELPPEKREPLFLHYLQGFSIQEIAERLGMKVSAVKVRLLRARRLLEKNPKLKPFKP